MKHMRHAVVMAALGVAWVAGVAVEAAIAVIDVVQGVPTIGATEHQIESLADEDVDLQVEDRAGKPLATYRCLDCACVGLRELPKARVLRSRRTGAVITRRKLVAAEAA